MVTLYIQKQFNQTKRTSIHRVVSFFIFHMNYLIHQLLNAEEINLIKKELDNCSQNWEDGKKTAGSQASIVKNNLQLNRNSEVSRQKSQLVSKKILSNDLIKSYSLPRIIQKKRSICK